MGGFTHNPLNKKFSRKGIHGDFYQCVLLYISFQKNINLLCLATCLGFVDITWTNRRIKADMRIDVSLRQDFHNIISTL